jgi:hypothetical protein
MQNLLQSVNSGRQAPKWFRRVALVCVMLVCVMSTVQAFHTHEDSTFTKQDSHHNRPAPEDNCPLCVAMHSALPVALHVAPEPMILVQALDSIAMDAERIFRWRFEMASRPPPAKLDRA